MHVIFARNLVWFADLLGGTDSPRTFSSQISSCLSQSSSVLAVSISTLFPTFHLYWQSRPATSVAVKVAKSSPKERRD